MDWREHRNRLQASDGEWQQRDPGQALRDKSARGFGFLRNLLTVKHTDPKSRCWTALWAGPRPPHPLPYSNVWHDPAHYCPSVFICVLLALPLPSTWVMPFTEKCGNCRGGTWPWFRAWEKASPLTKNPVQVSLDALVLMSHFSPPLGPMCWGRSVILHLFLNSAGST